MQAFVRRRSASAPDSGPLSGLGRAHGDSGQLHKDTMIHTHALTAARTYALVSGYSRDWA